ncbi:MAG TPA: hypothetical protein ENH98_00940 [archaeon]|nr:hypothetical protein [archaeon]
MKKKVLIVGNDLELISLSEKRFKLWGYETITCFGEQEALKLQRSEGETIGSVFYPTRSKLPLN